TSLPTHEHSRQRRLVGLAHNGRQIDARQPSCLYCLPLPDARYMHRQTVARTRRKGGSRHGIPSQAGERRAGAPADSTNGR
ncbi:MAG TPA: hypothetical protein VFW76_02155, partial [Ktedonobacterales bacterium]|nr:hypothetical protein [Ktedonobacterales bacterium]